MSADAYYNWLIGLIGDGCIETCYQKLLWKLYTTDFYYELDFDRNRAEDGLQLRKRYYTGLGHPISYESLQTCSLLEMFIALSQRAENNLIYDPTAGDNTSHWFWSIMSNLGLNKYDDCYYFEGSINNILYNFMHHHYAEDGRNGGAFPCPGINRDLRNMDLWWQLGAYFMRNYPLQIA